MQSNVIYRLFEVTEGNLSVISFEQTSGSFGEVTESGTQSAEFLKVNKLEQVFLKKTINLTINKSPQNNIFYYEVEFG